MGSRPHGSPEAVVGAVDEHAPYTAETQPANGNSGADGSPPLDEDEGPEPFNVAGSSEQALEADFIEADFTLEEVEDAQVEAVLMDDIQAEAEAEVEKAEAEKAEAEKLKTAPRSLDLLQAVDLATANRSDEEFLTGLVDEDELAAVNPDYEDDFDSEDEEAEKDALSQVMLYLKDQRYRQHCGSMAEVLEESQFGILIEESDVKILQKEHTEQKIIKATLLLDMVSGVVVATNGLIMGLQVDRVLPEDGVFIVLIDNVFLAFFISEWSLRWFFQSLKIGWKPGFKAMLRDRWTGFDFFVILVSVFDWVMAFVDIESGTSMLAIFRVVRLMRLIRLVRLLKLLKNLWILVSGLMKAQAILMWAVLLLFLIAYAFGILMLELYGKEDLYRDNDEVQLHFGSIAQAVLSMMQVATFDSYVPMWKTFIEGDETYEPSPMAGAVFLVFMPITGLGILNLMVGVLLTSALEVTTHDEGYEANLIKLRRHQALRNLKSGCTYKARREADAKKTDGEREREHRIKVARVKASQLYGLPLENKDPPAEVTRQKLLDYYYDPEVFDMDTIESWRPSRSRQHKKAKKKFRSSFPQSDDSTPTSSNAVGEDSGAKQSSELKEKRSNTESFWLDQVSGILGLQNAGTDMMELFEKAEISTDHVVLVYNELESLLASNATSTVDDFIEGCMWLKGQVHETDILHYVAGLKSAYSRVCRLSHTLDHCCKAIKKTCDDVEPVLLCFNTPRTHDEQEEADRAADVPITDVAKAGTDLEPWGPSGNIRVQISKQDRMDLKHLQKLALLKKKWVNFDMLFSGFVIANAISTGIEISVMGEMPRDPSGAEKFNANAAIYFGLEHFFFVVYSLELVIRVVLYYQLEVLADTRTWLRLPSILFDFELKHYMRSITYFPHMLRHDLFVSIDVALAIIASADNFFLRYSQAGEDFGDILRILRLLRLVRMLRLLHMVPELGRLAKGFSDTASLQLWATLALVGFAYTFAIACADTMGGPLKKEAALFNETGDSPVYSETGADIRDVFRRWGTVRYSLITLLSISSFDSWAFRIEELAMFYTWAYLPLGLFTWIAGVGFLNLVTGVMVQGAFHMIGKQKATAAEQVMLKTKDLLIKCKDLVFKEIKATVTARHLEMAEINKKVGGVTEDLDTHQHHALLALAGAGSMCKWDLSDSITDADHMEQLGVTDKAKEAEEGEEETEKEEDPLKSASAKAIHKNPVHSHLILELSKPEPEPEHNWGLEVPDFWAVHKISPGGGFDEVLTLRELSSLLSHKELIEQLHKSGLRPDQALMVFQKLDVLNMGTVKVENFIEGMLRMKQMVQGLDVSSAKSYMRRLVVDLVNLRTRSMDLHQTLTAIDQKLRMVRVVSDDFSVDSYSHHLQVRALVHKHQCAIMAIKLKNVKKHILARKHVLYGQGFGGNLTHDYTSRFLLTTQKTEESDLSSAPGQLD